MVREPARADRRGLQAGADIDRIVGEPPIADTPLDIVGRARSSVNSPPCGLADILRPTGPSRVELHARGRADRIARQHRAVGQPKRKEARRARGPMRA